MMSVFLCSCAVTKDGTPCFLKGFEMRGFSQETPFCVYNERNLFDYIDGEADIYFPHGFRLLYTAKIRSADDALMVLDIYDMGTPEGAEETFNEFSGDGLPVENATAEKVCEVDSVLLMTRGRFFVRILPYSSGGRKDIQEFSRIADLSREIDKVLQKE